MDLFGGKKEATLGEVLEALSTVIGRISSLENKMNVIEERYETLAKEQAMNSSSIKEIRQASGESLADLGAKVKTLGIETGKLKEETKRLARLSNDMARQDEVIEIRKRIEMGK